MRKHLIYISFLLCSLLSSAQAPAENNNNWPLEMNSAKHFDIASKCEMLVFVEVFNKLNTLTDNNLAKQIKVKNVRINSVNLWKKETKDRILANFNKLSEESLGEIIPLKANSSWNVISKVQLGESLPSIFLNWYKTTQEFYKSYIKEQLRLAALYPRITSEILQLSKNEIQGFNFDDKKFLLTFDDGPTKINGNTDKMIEVLDTYNLSGMFFVLGDNLNKRLKSSSVKSLNELYGENKVFSHGRVHKAHQKYTLWKESIDYTNDLLHSIFPAKDKASLLYFRPPYGQRNQKLTDYFNSKNSKIIFWNIDSRDWSSKLNAQQVANREIKLMLLWRKGILLFHDVHKKVQVSLPIIHQYFKNTDIIWMKASNVVK